MFVSQPCLCPKNSHPGPGNRPKKAPLVGANIALRNTYDGATADAEGRFQFETEETGAQVLQVTYLGYDSVVQQVTLTGGRFDFNPILKEGFNELKVVVISAGAFEASDARRVTVLKPLDIVTTASAGGDTCNALKTLPGAQVSSGGDPFGFAVKNNNVYTNLSWAGLLLNKWKLNLGTSYSNDWNTISSSYSVGLLTAEFRLPGAIFTRKATACCAGKTASAGCRIFSAPNTIS